METKLAYMYSPVSRSVMVLRNMSCKIIRLLLTSNLAKPILKLLLSILVQVQHLIQLTMTSYSIVLKSCLIFLTYKGRKFYFSLGDHVPEKHAICYEVPQGSVVVLTLHAATW